MGNIRSRLKEEQQHDISSSPQHKQNLLAQKISENYALNQRFFESLANDDVWTYLLCNFVTYVDIIRLSRVSKQFQKLTLNDQVCVRMRVRGPVQMRGTCCEHDHRQHCIQPLECHSRTHSHDIYLHRHRHDKRHLTFACASALRSPLLLSFFSQLAMTIGVGGHVQVWMEFSREHKRNFN